MASNKHCFNCAHSYERTFDEDGAILWCRHHGCGCMYARGMMYGEYLCGPDAKDFKAKEERSEKQRAMDGE